MTASVVIALADLTLEVRGVEAGSAYVPPADVVRLAEETVGTALQRLEVRTLVDDLDALQVRWTDRVSRQLPTGTVATALAVTELEAQLTPRVADVVDQRDGRGRC